MPQENRQFNRIEAVSILQAQGTNSLFLPYSVQRQEVFFLSPLVLKQITDLTF